MMSYVGSKDMGSHELKPEKRIQGEISGAGDGKPLHHLLQNKSLIFQGCRRPVHVDWAFNRTTLRTR